MQGDNASVVGGTRRFTPALGECAAHAIPPRPSDVDAPCSGGLGCGAGDYWLDINIANQTASAQDPVLQLQTQFAAWQAAQVGRPDHYQSSVALSAPVRRAAAVRQPRWWARGLDDQPHAGDQHGAGERAAAGGGTFTLVGTSLLGATVTINGVAVAPIEQVDTVFIGTLPPGTAGPATIAVTNPNGCVTTRPFTYL